MRKERFWLEQCCFSLSLLTLFHFNFYATQDLFPFSISFWVLYWISLLWRTTLNFLVIECWEIMSFQKRAGKRFKQKTFFFPQCTWTKISKINKGKSQMNHCLKSKIIFLFQKRREKKRRKNMIVESSRRETILSGEGEKNLVLK